MFEPQCIIVGTSPVHDVWNAFTAEDLDVECFHKRVFFVFLPQILRNLRTLSIFGFSASLSVFVYSYRFVVRIPMKKDIHPQYFPDAKVTCACGAIFAVGSTKSEFNIEICSNCHPFYTGADKIVDTAGRVERFKAKQAKSASKKTAKKQA